MSSLAQKSQDKSLHHTLDVQAALTLGVQVLDPTHLTDCFDGSVRPDAVAWRLLLDEDLAVPKLGEKVVVHCTILVPVYIHHSQPSLVDGFSQSLLILAI